MRLPSLGRTACIGAGMCKPRTLMETSGTSSAQVSGDLVNVTDSSPKGDLFREVINLVTNVQSQAPTPELLFGAHYSPLTTTVVYVDPQINS